MIYIEKLNIKLNALVNLDLDRIVADKVDIPFLGKNYTKSSLQNWLKKRIDLLNDIKLNNYTDSQITNFINNIYNSLDASDKIIADSIIQMIGEPYKIDGASSADAHDKLCLLVLYKFVTTP